jgi:AraC-like DNA-binding protein
LKIFFEMVGRMKKKQRLFEPQLTIRHFAVLPGGEWQPPMSGWSLVQAGGGSGYCLRAQGSAELETGAVLVVAGQAGTIIRASQLGEMSLRTFSVVPSRLTGLITLGEQDFLKSLAVRKEDAVRVFPPQSPAALTMKEFCAAQRQAGLMFRLKLLQLFVEALGGELEPPAAPVQEISDAKERLRALLLIAPPGDLVEMSFSELARRTNCTPRHLSRIFQEQVGRSFSDQRVETRMARARELLATSNSKVVEVALESGYKSLSLFNLMFTRRFGISPGRWRQRNNNAG